MSDIALAPSLNVQPLFRAFLEAVCMPRPYAPLAVANEFIELAGAAGIDHMKLQKLVYYVQGMSCVCGERAINELPEVWKFGPVFPSLYFELKYHGGGAIKQREKDNLVGPAPGVDKNDKLTRELIQEVWAKFKASTAIQLSTRTHKSGTPWNTIARRHNWIVPRHTEIPECALGNYFRQYGLNG